MYFCYVENRKSKTMNFKLHLLLLFISHLVIAQKKSNLLLEQNIISLVEELEFMYGYDQAIREYTLYKTFNKSETDRIESLSDSLRTEEIIKRKFESDSIGLLIWNNYIHPKDAAHTERLIKITEKYGFPTVERLKKYYKKDFVDPEFNPLILFIHSPKKYWEQLKVLMRQEYQIGNINKCQYGYLLWHFTGRTSFQPMLDNGYEMVEENGKTTLRSTCN